MTFSMLNKRFPSLSKYYPEIASVLVGIVPVFIMIFFFGVSRKIIAKGAIAYAAGAVGLKLPLYHVLVVKVLHTRLSNTWLGISQGIVSACSELGASFLFFLYVVPDLTFAQLVGFGLASGSIEAIILPFMKNPLEGTPLEEHADETLKRSEGKGAVQWLGVVERIMATCIHIASRGLVYISYSTGNIFPALFAFAGFASIDGRAYFAHLEKWRFDEIRVVGRFYRYMGTITAVMVFLFVLIFYYGM